jgi:hypothetical protein
MRLNISVFILSLFLSISHTKSDQSVDNLYDAISNFSIDHFLEFLSTHEAMILKNYTAPEGSSVDYNPVLCMAQLRRYLKGVKNREFWAMYGKLI